MNTKEKIEIMQAWLGGKPIQYTDKGRDIWKDLLNEPLWNFKECDFRIKPKQKVKKTIKYLCFEHYQGALYLVVENSRSHTAKVYSKAYTRIPEFDMTREIEVEE